MCLCLKPKCLKFFIIVACVLILALGAILIWGGYRVMTEEFVKSLDYEFVGIIMISCGSALLLVSIIGFIGSLKEKKLILAVFIIFAFIISLLLIAFGAALIYARTIADDYLSSESECIDNYEDAEDGCKFSEDILCRVYCPCKADNDYIDSLVEDSKNKPGSEPYFVYADQGAENVLDCDPCAQVDSIDDASLVNLTFWAKEYFDQDVTREQCEITSDDIKDHYFTSDMRKYMPLLKWVENSFDCSGLCTPRTIYLFSDVDNGEPDGSCRSELNDWAQEKFLAFGIVAVIFGIYILFVTFFSCCLCGRAGKENVDEEKRRSKDDGSDYDIVSSDRN